MDNLCGFDNSASWLWLLSKMSGRIRHPIFDFYLVQVRGMLHFFVRELLLIETLKVVTKNVLKIFEMQELQKLYKKVFEYKLNKQHCDDLVLGEVIY